MTVADKSALALSTPCRHMLSASELRVAHSLVLTRAGILQTFVINFVLTAIAWVAFCFVRPKFPKAYKARATQYVSPWIVHVNVARVLKTSIEVMSAT